MAAIVDRPALAAGDCGAILHRAGDLAGSAVVRGQQNQRVLADSQLFEPRNRPADQLVRVGDHVPEVGRVPGFAARGPVRAVRRRHERVVDQGHRVVGEERPVGVNSDLRPDPVQQEVHEQVGTVLALVNPAFAAGAPQQRIGVALSLLVVVPHEIVVEAGLLRRLPLTLAAVLPRRPDLFEARHLPLAGHEGRVAGVLEQVGDGHFVRRQDSPLRVVAAVVPPGHQFESRGRTERHRVGVCKADPVRGESINVRRLVGRSAVGTDRFETQVIDQDEEDVRSLLRLGGGVLGRVWRRGATGRERHENREPTPGSAQHWVRRPSGRHPASRNANLRTQPHHSSPNCQFGGGLNPSRPA